MALKSMQLSYGVQVIAFSHAAQLSSHSPVRQAGGEPGSSPGLEVSGVHPEGVESINARAAWYAARIEGPTQLDGAIGVSPVQQRAISAL